MAEFKNVSKTKEKTLKLSDLGKDVIDKKGDRIGRLKEIHIDPEELTIEGISIDNGVFLDNDYVGKDYIAGMSENAVTLTITPLSQYLNMEVVDSEGKSVGNVIGVNRVRKTNTAISITVDRGLRKDDIIIADNYIKEISKKIMLSIPVD